MTFALESLRHDSILSGRYLPYIALAGAAIVGLVEIVTTSITSLRWPFRSPRRGRGLLSVFLVFLVCGAFIAPAIAAVQAIVSDLTVESRQLASPLSTKNAPPLALYDINHDGEPDVMALEGGDTGVIAIPHPENGTNVAVEVAVLGTVGATLAALFAVFKGGLDPREAPVLIGAVVEAAKRAFAKGEESTSSGSSEPGEPE